MTQFRIIPAVDLLDGKVVRLLRGSYDAVTVYHEEPGEQVDSFIRDGATLIHIVDLNAARTGDRNTNASAIAKILEATGNRARVELGGGIRSMESLAQVLVRDGIHRAILGTSALKDPVFLKEALEAFGPERIIVGVDARDGEVRTDGWEKEGGVQAIEFLLTLERAGVTEVIFTDIATDGAMTGPPLETLRAILDATSIRIIASGGVSSIEDVRSLLELGVPRPVGTITGRAVYEGKLSVREAVNLARTLSS